MFAKSFLTLLLTFLGAATAAAMLVLSSHGKSFPPKRNPKGNPSNDSDMLRSTRAYGLIALVAGIIAIILIFAVPLFFP